MNALRMALDSVREKKGRSFLTMLGIIIGVTAVLVLVALVSGYNADITAYYEKLGVNKVNVTVNWYDTSRSVDVIDALYDYGNGELGDMVLGVSPDLSTSLPMKYRTTTLDSGTLYLGSDQFSVCGNYTLKEGRDISAFDVDRRSRVCVLGSYVADSLFQYADPIGETVYFGGEPFTVVGIYYQKDGGEEGSMDDMAVIPYSLDRAILGTAQLTRFSVKVDQSDHMDTVMAKLERFLGETIDTSVGEYELENGNSAMSESTEEMTSMSVVLGGIAGINNGTITNSAPAESSSIRGGLDIGGVAGYNNKSGVITLENANGNVYGITATGGVAGYNLGTITARSVTVKVSGTTQTGGVAGLNAASGTIGQDPTDPGSISITVQNGTTVFLHHPGRRRSRPQRGPDPERHEPRRLYPGGKPVCGRHCWQQQRPHLWLHARSQRQPCAVYRRWLCRRHRRLQRGRRQAGERYHERQRYSSQRRSRRRDRP